MHLRGARVGPAGSSSAADGTSERGGTAAATAAASGGAGGRGEGGVGVAGGEEEAAISAMLRPRTPPSPAHGSSSAAVGGGSVATPPALRSAAAAAPPPTEAMLPALLRGAWAGLDSALAGAAFAEEGAAAACSAAHGGWLSGAVFAAHAQAVTGVSLSVALDAHADAATVFSTSKDGCLKLTSLADGRQRSSHCPSTSGSGLSAVVALPRAGAAMVSSWDNAVYVYSSEYGRVLQTVDAHDDSVSCLAIGEHAVVTGSWDSTVKVWALEDCGSAAVSIDAGGPGGNGCGVEFHELQCEVRCVAIGAAGGASEGLAVAGCEDGSANVFNIECEYLDSSPVVSRAGAAVCGVAFSPEGGIVAASADGRMAQFDAAGTPVASAVADAGVSSVDEVFRCVRPLKPGALLLPSLSPSLLTRFLSPPARSHTHPPTRPVAARPSLLARRRCPLRVIAAWPATAPPSSAAACTASSTCGTCRRRARSPSWCGRRTPARSRRSRCPTTGRSS